MTEPILFARVPAIVVGACGHGLAIMRALWQAGVPVMALESNPRLAGCRTRTAQIQYVPAIAGPELTRTLMELRPRIACPGKPVLFLTNDNMVRRIGMDWPQLDDLYRLSWSHCRQDILRLIEKSALADHARSRGLNYPTSFVLNSSGDIEEAIARIGFPMIVKPVRPLSGFKTALPRTPAELSKLVAACAADLPMLVQTFIPGDDRAIHFSALYLDQGRVLARFDGHKLRSRPLGHTTIAESLPNQEIYTDTLRFFDGLALSGPVSLELKRDVARRLWVIEPTLGRTDFWLGLCVANGVNLPLAEYCHQTGTLHEAMAQRTDTVWFNEERDPFGFAWMLTHARESARGRRSAYVYFDRRDPAPAYGAAREIGTQLVQSAKRRMMRWLHRPLALLTGSD